MNADVNSIVEKLREPRYFRDLVDRYKGYVFAVILRYINDHATAEDIAQETFIRAHTKLSEYHGGSMKIWLGRIAANLSIDYLRRRKEELEYSEDVLSAQVYDDVEEQILKTELEDRLNHVVESLDQKYRDVVMLYYYEHNTYKEIADKLQIAEKTVETRLYRARNMIKEEMKNEIY